MKTRRQDIPRIEYLRVCNFRALRLLELKELTALTVLVGPNGSGKSTVFDVFAFLSECFTTGLRKAWDRRGRFKELRSRETEVLADGRLMLQVKDAPFQKPVMAKFASDGTLKMLAYLTLLYDPEPPQLIGIEEPENQLHPRLLPELAEECRKAANASQLLITTHSPFFLNGLQSKEVWVLYRDDKGYTQARRAADMRGVGEFMDHGAKLGHLWMEGHFEAGDPLVNAGAPPRPTMREKRSGR